MNQSQFESLAFYMLSPQKKIIYYFKHFIIYKESLDRGPREDYPARG